MRSPLLSVSSRCGGIAPEIVFDGTSEMDRESFLPFGEMVSLFDECTIGADAVFSQKDAMAELSFHLSVQERLVPLSQAQELEELRIIKRKPRTIQYQAARTSPQKVELEYFNGVGWRRLPCEDDWSELFDGTRTGDFTIRFRCPADWMPAVSGGYEGRSLRLRVTRADDCYLRPCLHTMPRLSREGPGKGAAFTGDWEKQRLWRRAGLRCPAWAPRCRPEDPRSDRR